MNAPVTVIAVAQTNSKRGDVEANIKTHIKHTEQAAHHGAQLVIFPELSLTGYEPDIAETHKLNPTNTNLKPLQETADKTGTSILAGAPHRDTTGLHIAAFLYTPNKPPRVYTKHHLHPGEDKHFTPGNTPLAFNIDQETVSAAICADITHPEHAEAASNNGATIYAAGVMITPKGYANDAGLLRGYALKHRMTVLMSNYAGPTGGYPSAGRSAAWDKHGELIAEAPESGEVLVVIKLSDEGVHGEVLRL